MSIFDPKEAPRPKFFKDALRAIRNEAGYLQREVALEIGVNEATVRAWEAGANDPPRESIQKLFYLFNQRLPLLEWADLMEPL